MALSFWAKTSGTWINVFTIVGGTAIGLLLRDRLSTSLQRVVTQALGLTTIAIGLSMSSKFSEANAGAIDGTILGFICLAIGGLLGEWWRLEERLNAIGNWLQKRFRGKGRFTEGFVAASLLFCVGPLAILGSLNNGLTGENTLLVLKSSLDGIASIAFASSYGIGTGFSALSILLYQGGLSLAAGTLSNVIPNPETDPRVMLATGVGGLTILGLGINLLEMARIQVASFLPAIALAPIVFAIATWLANR